MTNIIKAVLEEMLHEKLFDSKDELVSPMEFSKMGEDSFAGYKEYHEKNGGDARFIAKYDENGNRIWD